MPGELSNCLAGRIANLSVGRLATEIRNSTNPRDVDPDTPYVGLEHIPRKSIALLEWGSVGQVQSAKLRFNRGDILFGKIRPYFHKVGFALTDGVASSDAIIIRPAESRLKCLVLMTASSDAFVRTASQTMKEGSKMPRADWKVMGQFTVLVPSKTLLKTFNVTIEPILAQLKTLALQTKKAQQARDLLLPRLMSGEVSV
jgi:type I restriction enzyme S subunit